MRILTSMCACMYAAAVLASCEVGPNYVRPQPPLSKSFDVTPSTQPVGTTAGAPVDLGNWWRSFNDPELDSLVERAVKSNLDLAIALERLQEARASEFVISGGVLPYLEASGAAARGSGNNSVKGRITPPLNAGTNTTGLKEITEVVGFDAGWELDLFGRFRRQLEAAAADTQASGEARNAVLISVISDVVRAYIELRTAQTRLAIAQQSVTASRQTLDTVRQRFASGLTNELDVALAQRQTAIQEASIFPLQEDIIQAQRRLAVLLGRSPESLGAELSARFAPSRCTGEYCRWRTTGAAPPPPRYPPGGTATGGRECSDRCRDGRSFSASRHYRRLWPAGTGFWPKSHG